MPHVITTAMVKQMREMRKRQKYLHQIAKEVGVSESTARKYTRDLGIDLRGLHKKRSAL